MRNIFYFWIIGFLSLQIQAQSLYFPPITGNTWDTISPQALGYCQPRIDSLYAYLDANNTKAFILLKDGKIVLEKYFGTHTQTTPWQWASAGKTITAFMVGMAQQEGHLAISDTTSTYLGQGWTNCTSAQEEKITVWHQLTMTSGLDDNVADPYCTIDTCLIYKADAGTRWAYHNAPYTLLDGVIENATGQSLNTYTTQKLKNPTGMTGSFIPIGYNNVFYSNARSMARFGLLILNKGNWNGTPIMTDTAYFQQMVNTSQALNKSYGYLWWLNGKESFMIPELQLVFPGSLFPNAPLDMISAMGKDGQFLNIVPSQNLIWLRMGEDATNFPVPYLLNQGIWDYVNALNCTSGKEDQQESGPVVTMYPNPANDRVMLQSTEQIVKAEIYTIHGQRIKSSNASKTEMILELDDLPGGFYVVHAMFTNGNTWVSKLMVN